jgi:hypothetical protein
MPSDDAFGDAKAHAQHDYLVCRYFGPFRDAAQILLFKLKLAASKRSRLIYQLLHFDPPRPGQGERKLKEQWNGAEAAGWQECVQCVRDLTSLFARCPSLMSPNCWILPWLWCMLLIICLLLLLLI